ncbi:MAG: DUF4907 domain-containing protein [Bacteroidota bacterium]|nr:DUF4907 domain-containing protein [Bacteroidota bacterium]MDP4211510.1 DUF4907 domain-containing protein [Bacteroidota bacterium]MDP4249725.1 DUF4907 domain-containing protein [Bacteroidota bacterium]
MIIRKKKYFILTVTALLICSAVIFFVRHERSGKRDHEGQIFLKAVPVQTTYGWGYNIMAGNKIYIHQDYIPAVAGKQGFKTREDALRVANRVIEKISANQLPVITVKDLEELGIMK